MVNRLLLLGFCLTLIPSALYAHDDFEVHEIKLPPIIELPEAEDNLYTDTDIKPFDKKLSVDESSQENSSDVMIIDNSDIPEALACGDERLREQIAGFIYKNINKKETNSIPEKRKRLLLVRNMAKFYEISEDDKDLRQNINVASALAYLKINQHRQIYKICKSAHNVQNDLENIYAIIYPFAGYYKIVAANLVTVPEKIDEATFIFSW